MASEEDVSIEYAAPAESAVEVAVAPAGDTTNGEGVPLSESAGLREILEWSKGRPNWQRDALRRLVENGGDLTDADLDDLYGICLDENTSFESLDEGHIAPGAVIGHPVSLKAVDHPVGINALVDDQGVGFEVNGVSVVYGDNGSGKSGYVRILKDACRSRDVRSGILPNIAEPEPANQSAQITYQRGDDVLQYDWSPKEDPHPHLPSVSIFDSRSANTHLGGQHNVAYTPFPMLVLKKLSDTCDEINSRLAAEIKNLEGQVPAAINAPALAADTAAGAFLHKVSADTKPAELEKLVTISPEEQKRHDTLAGDLSGDSRQIIASLNSQKSRLITAVDGLRNLVGATNEAAFQTMKQLFVDVDAKAAAAKVATEDLFGASKLPHVGEDLWRTVWEAARAYSDQEAKPDSTFPQVTPDDDVCVLCEQPIGKEAARRWDTLEKFVKGTTKAEEEQARRKLEEAKATAGDFAIPAANVDEVKKLIADELGDGDLAAEFEKCWAVSTRRLKALIDGTAAPEGQIALPETKLMGLIHQIDARVAELGLAVDSPERKALVFELQGLKDQIALLGIKEDVLAHVTRLGNIQTLKMAAKSAAKKPVTAKNKDLSDKLVTDKLRDRFAREIKKLDVLQAPVELVKAGDRSAESYFHVVLVGNPDKPLHDILSEGEHRCVALAAFLAELVTAREYSGIVFDDPMSSLDHLYRKKVAVRLVEEAEHRQVVIFTHDLAFLFEIRRQAAEQGRNVKYQHVQRRGEQPGHVKDSLPNKAKNGAQAVEDLRKHLKELKGQFAGFDEATRTTINKGVLEQIREGWELAIADAVYPVLERFSSHIRPSSMKLIAILTDQDAEIVREAQGRISEDLHAGSHGLNPAEIGYDELSAEVSTLFDWISSVRQRQDEARKTLPSR